MAPSHVLSRSRSVSVRFLTAPSCSDRLIKSWRVAKTLPAERVCAAQALVNMGSPRYVAAIKERLLDAQQEVAGIARYLEELQRLAASGAS
jgi:hypothetical protein